MSDAEKKLLPLLIQVSKIDASLARISQERKRIKAELDSRFAAVRKSQLELDAKNRDLSEKKQRYGKEEKLLKDEREKLVARRQALSTLSNYKLQQAAEREMESISAQLDAREESLIQYLEEISKLESLAKGLSDTFVGLKEEFSRYDQDAKQELIAFDNQEREKIQERHSFVSTIDPVAMNNYEKVRTRFPADAVTAVTKGSCAGCFMQVGAQTLLLISRGDTLVKCPGCGRLLFIAQ